ncbi:probable serine/threonine-protein kinase clkA [Octopus bimaculoides]|uniref:probable serine/threonine-protein kinase clkA n=1 Tax=Octopus bimaculoides TaxID=37653 RepID=UPI0022E52FC9|nr:probable serine/threonine-protein kinase clkA [Octopus bimaculoides]
MKLLERLIQMADHLLQLLLLLHVSCTICQQAAISQSDMVRNVTYRKVLNRNFRLSFGINRSHHRQERRMRSVIECSIFCMASPSCTFFTFWRKKKCERFNDWQTITLSSSKKDVSYIRLHDSSWYKAFSFNTNSMSNPADVFFGKYNQSRPNSEFYRSSLLDVWDSLNINEVKIVLRKADKDVLTLKFAAINTNIGNWFSGSNLKSTPWSDLPPDNTTYKMDIVYNITSDVNLHNTNQVDHGNSTNNIDYSNQGNTTSQGDNNYQGNYSTLCNNTEVDNNRNERSFRSFKQRKRCNLPKRCEGRKCWNTYDESKVGENEGKDEAKKVDDDDDDKDKEKCKGNGKGKGDCKDEEKDKEKCKGDCKDEEKDKEKCKGNGKGKGDCKDEEKCKGKGKGDCKDEEKDKEKCKGNGKGKEKCKGNGKGKGDCKDEEKDKEKCKGKGKGDCKDEEKDKEKCKGKGDCKDEDKGSDAGKDKCKNHGKGQDRCNVGDGSLNSNHGNNSKQENNSDHSNNGNHSNSSNDLNSEEKHRSSEKNNPRCAFCIFVGDSRIWLMVSNTKPSNWTTLSQDNRHSIWYLEEGKKADGNPEDYLVKADSMTIYVQLE